mgnify:FL=1
MYEDIHRPGSRLILHYGDLADLSIIRKVLYSVSPDEFYNLGAQSHVRISFDLPEYTADVSGLGTLRVLEAIKDFSENTGRKVKFYQASSSEMFGGSPPPQREDTPFYPRSPYGAAKVFAFHTTVNYREAYGIFAVNGILFNHESPRRGETFVSRKITKGIASILSGKSEKIYLGNLESQRDWGYAPEYVEAMWQMTQEESPDDFGVSTGESHSVREFLEEAFQLVGLDWRKFVEMDKRYLRPTETNVLRGDYSKAKRILGWEPRTKFKDLVRIMLEADIGRKIS